MVACSAFLFDKCTPAVSEEESLKKVAYQSDKLVGIWPQRDRRGQSFSRSGGSLLLSGIGKATENKAEAMIKIDVGVVGVQESGNKIYDAPHFKNNDVADELSHSQRRRVCGPALPVDMYKAKMLVEMWAMGR
ncbi:hypothetical protein NDU88_008548 [Pleurodeles waltl]|uniref:Uncharacterized protein n=1 Tax=Pleurodeles waltl TaxID=8319 RepID=A0AAV7N9G5_PLEWA|nr:hypothetical protein NDU88_008548 [Pleurodeles waltl]